MGRAIYYFFVMVMAGSGLWLLIFSLEIRGLFPFSPGAALSPQSRLVSTFSPSVSYWADEILAWSETWNLDPILVATVMQIESCGNPNVVSPAGAQGLFQVMPYHFEQNENTLDPETNAQRGLAYLSQSLSLSSGDIALALAGYNGGHGQITREKFLWPEETQRYARWGTGIYMEAFKANAQSKTLSAWLEAGGWQLCREAEQVLSLP